MYPYFLDKAQQNWAKFDPELNHFFAFAVKDAIAGGLDPKPVAYRKGVETIHP